MIDQADLIFVFDRANYANLQSRWPGARRKIFYLGMLAPSGPVTIDDPYGRSSPEFEACYREISGAIDVLAAMCRRGLPTASGTPGAVEADPGSTAKYRAIS